jgi:hypothetical protein
MHYLINCIRWVETKLVAQEWWILFEDASEYFAYCKRKKLKPSLKHFIQLGSVDIYCS